MHSLETTLTTLIHIKNSFITDYADNDDIQDNMKNSFYYWVRWLPGFQYQMRNDFIIDHADYTDLQDHIKNNFIIETR